MNFVLFFQATVSQMWSFFDHYCQTLFHLMLPTAASPSIMKDCGGDARQMARRDISCYPFSVCFLRPLIALKEASDV